MSTSASFGGLQQSGWSVFFLWVESPGHWIMYSRRFVTTYRSHLQESRSPILNIGFFFHTVLFLCLQITKNALIFSSLLFYSTAPTCFDMCVSLSGSSSVPVELHTNRIQWLIRHCVIGCYVSVMWKPGTHRSVWLCCRRTWQHNRHITTYKAESYQPLHPIRM
jgi:hypothetical protein